MLDNRYYRYRISLSLFGTLPASFKRLIWIVSNLGMIMYAVYPPVMAVNAVENKSQKSCPFHLQSFFKIISPFLLPFICFSVFLQNVHSLSTVHSLATSFS